LTGGLTARGHSCHVLTWAAVHAPAVQQIGPVVLRTVTRGYWPVLERLLPGSRDVMTRRRAVRQLDRLHRYDWIEIESDEGVDIGVQRDHGEKTILRVHTTLAQMVRHKGVPLTRRSRVLLERERRSVGLAARVITHSQGHAQEIERAFPVSVPIAVVRHGIDLPEPHRRPAGHRAAQFLVVGSPDRRKGFDRLRPVIEAYAGQHGGCRLVIVADCQEPLLREFGLVAPWPNGVEVVRRAGLSDEALYQEYERSSALLHLARYESFGYPLIEAAAAGTPVVATATGIAPELLDGELGHLLVHGDDAVAWAEAMHRAVERRSEVGTVLRRRYEQGFTRDRMVDGYLRTLDAWSSDG
jgi:glycogen(starch) synthase